MTLQVHVPEGAAQRSAGDELTFARTIIQAEAAALLRVADGLGDPFQQAIDLLDRATSDGGRIALTGTGKSADVAQKIAGTLNSHGLRAYLLDSTRAAHGDLGMVHPTDVVLALSHSGESEEVLRLLGPLRDLAGGLVALTGSAVGTLARKADVAIVYGPLDEVCPLGLSPSASTTVMLAIGDALAFTLSRRRGVGREQFARFHPAGSLGRHLARVESVMRQGHDIRVAALTDTVRVVFSQSRARGRRTGAVMLLDLVGRLCGLFTDSDLARLIEQRRDDALDRPISEVMTPHPYTIPAGARVAEAVALMRRHKISELPVVDARGRPLGLLDITDLIGHVEAEEIGRVA
jgi:arabinose-5-phosphate isomerase